MNHFRTGSTRLLFHSSYITTLMIIANITLLLLSQASGNKNNNNNNNNFNCERPSENEAGDFIDKIIQYNYCLDSDPLPDEIFVPSNLNLFMKSSEIGPGATAITYLGGGMYAYGNGGYMGSIITYECRDDWIDSNSQDANHDKITTVRMCPNAGRLGAILVDAPPALGADLGTFVYETLNERNADLMMMIVTHEHNDHNGNLNSIRDANPTLDTFVASKATIDGIRKLSNPTYSNPRVQEIYTSNPTFPDYPDEFDVVIDEDNYRMEVGNQTLDFRIVAGHGAGGNLLIWHEHSKTIINIDPPFEAKWSAFFELAIGNNVPELFKLFDIYKEYRYQQFIAGHSTHVGTRQDIVVAEMYVVDILDAAHRAVEDAAADPTSLANFNNIAFNRVNVLEGTNAGNFFVAFREYYAQLNVMCADTVLDRKRNYSGRDWVKRLAGVRATIYSHCSMIMFSLLTDTPGTVVQ